jgi:hypothetical protein
MVNITVCCGSVGSSLSIWRPSNALEEWRRKCKRSNLRVLQVVTELSSLVIMGCVPGHNKLPVHSQVMEIKVVLNGKDTGRKVQLLIQYLQLNQITLS